MYGPLCGPGSEGSEGSARLWQAGSKGGGIALQAMSFIARLAGTGLHRRPPPSTTSWSPSTRRAVGGKFEGRGTPPPIDGKGKFEGRGPLPTKWDRQGLMQRSSPLCYLPTPFPGGGWRAQRDGRGRLDGPLRGPGSEGSGGGFAASFKKGARLAPQVV